MLLESGTRIRSYEILAPIGSGVTGELYQALDIKLNREAAIEVLPEALTATTAALLILVWI